MTSLWLDVLEFLEGREAAYTVYSSISLCPGASMVPLCGPFGLLWSYKMDVCKWPDLAPVFAASDPFMLTGQSQEGVFSG